MTIVLEKKLAVKGKLLKQAKLSEEWYEDVDDPEKIASEIKHQKLKIDIFSFWQRIPNLTPIYSYPIRYESIAVLKVTTYQDWFDKQISGRTRNIVRKAEKKILLRKADFNDLFIRGMQKIFNETKYRQGKKFWHYGKSFEQIASEFSANLFRETIIGAYYEDELIGFLFLADTGSHTIITQILSMIKHRDKATNNALLAKAVEITVEKKRSHMVYAMWPKGSLAEFKRRNGFNKVDVPRYHVPITNLGKVAIALNLHRSIKEMIPQQVKSLILKIAYLIGNRNAM